MEFKGSHLSVSNPVGVRWYVAYPISYRQLEEMMEERGVEVDHSTLNRWSSNTSRCWINNFVLASAWSLELAIGRDLCEGQRLLEVFVSAVDKTGATVDFLLTARRDRKAALRFLRKAIGHHGVPEKITIDKSGANKAAIESYNAEHQADVEIRQVKYLNNILEQDHRAVKRVARPTLGSNPSDRLRQPLPASNSCI